jgi:hypothetical protein
MKLHDIKWYELQVELTDHMDEYGRVLEKDPELTFHQVNTMPKINGRNGFKAIEETYSNTKKEFKSTIKMIAEYFKFPKILAILLAFFSF